MDNTVDLEKLRLVINRLFDHIINTRNIKSVELSENFYWVIDSEQSYDMDKKPSEFTIGSFKDDWEFLSKLLDQDEFPVAYQLTELGPLLILLGETLGKELAKNGG